MSMCFVYVDGTSTRTNRSKGTGGRKKPGIVSEEESDRVTGAGLLGACIFLPSKPDTLYFVQLSQTKDGKGVSQDIVELSNKLILQILKAKNRKILYNAQEILRVIIPRIDAAKVALQNVYDVRIAAWLLAPDNSTDQYTLDNLLPKPSAPLAPSESETDTNSDDVAPLDRIKKDFLSTMEIWAELQDKVEKAGLMEAMNFESEVVPVLSRMEWTGIGFKPEALTSHQDLIQKHLDKLEAEARQLLGPGHESLNLASPQQVSKVMYEELKLPTPTTSTATGASGQQGRWDSKHHSESVTLHIATGEATLKELSKLHRFPAILLQHRHLSKVLNNWTAEFASKARMRDNMWRMHTSWCHTGTGTGRLSSANPNLQNVPKGDVHILGDAENADNAADGLFINVRDAFTAAEGYQFVSADYAAFEIRIMAHFCQDEDLCRILRDDSLDAMRAIASTWLGKPTESVTPQERERAKRILYGTIYGIGPQALGEQMKVTKKEASTWMQSFLNKYPRLKNFMLNTVHYARQNGFVKTLTGRKRFLPDITSDQRPKQAYAERQAVNSVIQGSAADVVKLAMLRLSSTLIDQGHKCRLLLQIHDDLIIEVPDAEVESMCTVMSETMSSVISLRVPLKVQLAVGKSWGKLKQL